MDVVPFPWKKKTRDGVKPESLLQDKGKWAIHKVMPRLQNGRKYLCLDSRSQTDSTERAGVLVIVVPRRLVKPIPYEETILKVKPEKEILSQTSVRRGSRKRTTG